MKAIPVFQNFIIKFCIIWISVGVPFTILGFHQLVAFIEKYLSPDNHLSSPIFCCCLILFSPIVVSAIFLYTYTKWKFPPKFLKIYLMLFIMHILFYYIYTHFILADMPMEDSFLEWGTAILAFLASFLFFYSGMIGSRFYFILCIAWLIFALEEISWGQRVFNFNSPQLFMAYNLQHEINIHNFFVNPHTQWIYYGFNLLLFGLFTWLREIPFLLWLYKIQGVKNTMRVSDKYGLWMIPFFTLFIFQFMGAEFVEEQWGLLGALLSLFILIDHLHLKSNK